ncbi:MAG: NAD(P)/FAD-dependent oxidoreductase [Acidimicrobiales bacterium]
MSTSSNIRNRSVVVAGGGPAGAVAALLLARDGAHVTVLERGLRSAALGAGLLLQPNGLAVLYALGLRESLEAVATRSSSTAVRDGRGRVLVESPVPDYGHGLDHVLALRRSHLASVLDEALDNASGVDVHYECEVLDVDRAGFVTYTRASHDNRLAADLVIGADGVHSSVRRRMSFASRLTATGHTYFRGITPGTFDVAPGEYWTALGLFGCAPLGDGTTYFYGDATLSSIERAMADADADAFRQAWISALPALAPLLAAIESTSTLLVNHVYRVDCTSFVDRRLVVVGDAAHAMAPTLGQGANSALVDCAILVDELRRGQGIEDALAAYDRRRRPVVQRVQHDADRVARLSSMRSGVSRALRDRALRASNRPRSARKRYDASLQIDPAELRQMVGSWAEHRAVHATPARA